MLLKTFIKTTSIATLLFSLNASAAERLVFAADLIRHGDRTPIHDIPSDPHDWPQGLGELTAEGMNQEFQLGTQLRKQYVEQTHLLPAHYTTETVYVRSTDMNRTLMSAESMLMGLYPPGTGPLLSANKKPALPNAFSPIPIHTIPTDQDKLLLPKTDKNIFSLIKLYWFKQTVWKEKTAPIEDKLKRWEDVTGIDTHDPEKISQLADNLFIREVHHVGLPKGISTKDAAEIRALGKWVTVTALKTKEATYSMGHEFLTTLATYLKQASEENKPLKYVLFSAHDSSIMSVMTTLGVPLEEVPHYASHLNFALVENDQKYYVRVTFNDVPVMIPGCRERMCSLEEFVAVTER